jgi:hypothetical protein
MSSCQMGAMSPCRLDHQSLLRFTRLDKSFNVNIHPVYTFPKLDPSKVASLHASDVIWPRQELRGQGRGSCCSTML